MRISTFWYCIKQGFQNIHRNKLFSLASIGTIAASIFLFSLFYSLIDNFEYIVREAETNVGITVFFDFGLAEEKIVELEEQIKAREEVEHTNYISAEEAWNIFQDKYFGEHKDLAQGYAEDNPLANCASLEIFLKNVEDQKKFVEYLGSIEEIRKVNYSEMAVSGLSTLNRALTYVSAGIVIILFGVAVFLIMNTISVSISVRQEEIRIMRLIGATNFFIRQPFMVEGLIIGVIGAALPLGVMYYIYDKVVHYAATKLSILSGIIVFKPVGEVFTILLPIALLLGAGIGLFGSIFSIRKHLKV